MTFPLTVAPFWKASGPGAGLVGASPAVQATYSQGSSNGAQPALSNVLQVDATQKFRFGSVCRFTDETYGEIEAVYLKGVGSLNQYDAVVYNSNTGATTRLITGADASLAGPVAIALSNPNASQFGWFAVFGQVPVNASGTLANESVAATGTAGQIGDANDTLDTQGNITGMVSKEAAGGTNAGFSNCQLHYPWCWEK